MSQLSRNRARKTCPIINSTNKPFLKRIGGREPCALTLLRAASATGCTARNVGAAWRSAYLHSLRQRGEWIEAVNEVNRNEFPDMHARYVQHSSVCLKAELGAPS